MKKIEFRTTEASFSEYLKALPDVAFLVSAGYDSEMAAHKIANAKYKSKKLNEGEHVYFMDEKKLEKLFGEKIDQFVTPAWNNRLKVRNI